MAKLSQLPSAASINALKRKTDIYLWKGIPVARRWPQWRLSQRATAVVAQQRWLTAANKVWQCCTPPVKQSYNVLARRTGWTGRDLFMKYFFGSSPMTYFNPLHPETHTTPYPFPDPFDHYLAAIGMFVWYRPDDLYDLRINLDHASPLILQVTRLYPSVHYAKKAIRLQNVTIGPIPQLEAPAPFIFTAHAQRLQTHHFFFDNNVPNERGIWYGRVATYEPATQEMGPASSPWFFLNLNHPLGPPPITPFPFQRPMFLLPDRPLNTADIAPFTVSEEPGPCPAIPPL